MILLSILFIFNLIIGGVFVWKYVFKSHFFLSQAIFAGAYSIIIFILMVLGIRLNSIIVFFPLVFIPFILYKINVAPWTGLPPNKRRNIYSCLLAFFVLLTLLVGAAHIMKSPVYEGDGLAIWLTKAKMITLDRTIYSENFFDPHRIHDHPRYPLLLPLLESSFFFAVGIDERLVKLIFVYIWVLIIGSLYEALRRKSLNTALASIAIIALIPAYYTLADGGIATGYADIPLGLFYLGAFVLLADYLDTGNRKPLIGAGLCLAFSIFTKNEGLLFTIIMFFFVLIKKRRKSDILITLSAIVLPVLPWLILAQHLPSLYAEHYLSYVPEFYLYLHRIPLIAKTALFEIFDLRHWGLFWPLSIFVFMHRKPKPETIHFAAALMLLIIFYLGIFIITPWDVEFQMKIVYPRMLLHIMPATLFLAARQYAAGAPNKLPAQSPPAC